MITGEIKNRIDAIWDTYWVGGITNPMSVLEQMTYLFFMKMIDDAQLKKEAEAKILGVKIANPTFKDGMWHNLETDNDVPYNSLRWHVFKNMEATQMFNTIRNDAFAFIKNLSSGRATAYSKFMRDAVFLIQNPRTLTKIVDGVDALDMTNRDAMGDVYEYILGKMAASGNNGQFRTPRHIIRMMVELMQPTLKDEICDPAMGSAGFIVESAKYIAEHYKQELLKKENADHCGRSGITDLKISDEITNREYQKRAIRAICENFTKLLPSATTARLDDFKPADKESVMKARILFSTYQTMINYIDTELKEFSIGRFDLIVIDEVHRSIFGKYTSILSYFDALMVGLTATPREDDDRSTYELFERESGEPNFEYLLEEAVSDGYLVDKQVLPRTTDILKNGIKYDKLTEEEKQQMESIWKYEKAKLNIPDDELYRRNIEHEELFSYIFNENTIDKVIIDLMENGLKINGGDTIGKTIIFAYNHNHAVLIVDRFKQMYPALGDDFCQLIDNTVNYAQSLIDTFEVRGKMPQIAVSVDMLDTGIDVPDILNLVFFKQVRSKIKFLQMIGRGTRLSEEIFDEGETPEDRAKKFFYIFNWCGNFEFFGENPKGYEPLKSISLTQRLFDLRVDLAIALRHEQYQNDEVAKALHDEVKAILMGQVKELNDKHISVREHWDMVDNYRRKETWVYLSNTDGIELKDVIAPLLVNGTTNMGATKFDILMLNIELSQIDEAVSGDKSKLVVEKVANKLQEKASIKQVNDKMPLIKQLSKHEFWESMSQASSQPTMKVATPSKRSKKAQEVRFIPSGSILTNILDDNEVRKLIHNMMELEDGTTIDTIYLECQREFQERYFSMTGNEWRHLVRDYVREVTQQPNLQEKEVFRFAMAV